MVKSRTVESLQVKPDEIASAVEAYSANLEQARKDLSHIDGALAILQSSGDRKAMTAYFYHRAMWKRGALFLSCVSGS